MCLSLDPCQPKLAELLFLVWYTQRSTQHMIWLGSSSYPIEILSLFGSQWTFWQIEQYANVVSCLIISPPQGLKNQTNLFSKVSIDKPLGKECGKWWPTEKNYKEKVGIYEPLPKLEYFLNLRSCSLTRG